MAELEFNPQPLLPLLSHTTSLSAFLEARAEDPHAPLRAAQRCPHTSGGAACGVRKRKQGVRRMVTRVGGSPRPPAPNQPTEPSILVSCVLDTQRCMRPRAGLCACVCVCGSTTTQDTACRTALRTTRQSRQTHASPWSSALGSPHRDPPDHRPAAGHSHGPLGKVRSLGTVPLEQVAASPARMPRPPSRRPLACLFNELFIRGLVPCWTPLPQAPASMIY